MYSVVACVLLIMASLRLVIVVNIGKFFSTLIRTIVESRVNNFTFIIVLLLIQPAFACFSYLAFGYTLIDFNNLGTAFYSCLNIMFGVFYHEKYYHSEPILGPIFFFLYIIIINMLLLNIFVAVIDSSYRKIKEENKNIVEKYSMIRIFLFCCFRKKRQIKQNTMGTIEGEFEETKRLRVFLKLNIF